jgi:hypothetical protein
MSFHSEHISLEHYHLIFLQLLYFYLPLYDSILDKLFPLKKR